MLPKVTAVIVTYNRKNLLIRCLNSLLQQTVRLEKIIVLDNASTDGTEEAINSKGFLEEKSVEYIQLTSNTGGSGGFHEGIKKAGQQDDRWLWLMDDDVDPTPQALENLLEHADSKGNIYGSVAIEDKYPGKLLCWPITIKDDQNGYQSVVLHDMLPETSPVQTLPFLGFFIHTTLVKRIGLPEKNFFVCGEDVEYCLRARLEGAKVIFVKSSILRHPLPQRSVTNFLGRKIYVLYLAPWKQYYDVRNRILIAKKHFGILLWFQTLPGILIRWGTILLRQDNRWRQSRAFCRGIIDGLLGRNGSRWPPGT